MSRSGRVLGRYAGQVAVKAVGVAGTVLVGAMAADVVADGDWLTLAQQLKAAASAAATTVVWPALAKVFDRMRNVQPRLPETDWLRVDMTSEEDQ